MNEKYSLIKVQLPERIYTRVFYTEEMHFLVSTKFSQYIAVRKLSNCELNLSRWWYEAKILSLRFFKIIEVSKPLFYDHHFSNHLSINREKRETRIVLIFGEVYKKKKRMKFDSVIFNTRGERNLKRNEKKLILRDTYRNTR